MTESKSISKGIIETSDPFLSQNCRYSAIIYFQVKYILFLFKLTGLNVGGS